MRTGPTRSTSPACFLARLRRDFRAVYLAGLLCCAMLLPACLLVWLGVYLRVFWLSLAGGAAGGLLGAQGVCGLFDTLLRSRRGRLMDQRIMTLGIMVRIPSRTSRRIQGKRKIFL